MPFVLMKAKRLVELLFAVGDDVASDKAHPHRLQFIQQALA